MSHTRLLVVGAVVAAIGILPVAVAKNSRPDPAKDRLNANDLALLGGVIELVQHDYVHPIGSADLTKDALKGMLNRLDPHSDYMDEQEFKESQSDISGKFGGLGIEISQQAGFPKVIAPIDGTPAARAGLQPGDLIVAVNGESVQDQNLDKIVRVLRGPPGSSVKLTIARGEDKPFDVSIVRSIIQVHTVKSKLEPNGIGYVRITEFGADSPRHFKEALETLKNQAGGKLNGLVLD